MAGTPPSTPKAKPVPLPCPDTVSRFPLTSQSGYRTRDPTEGRRAVLNDPKKYYQVDYERLLRSRFGTYPSSTRLAQIREKLEGAGQMTQGGQWSTFFTPPCNGKSKEVETFQPLKDIVATIFENTPNTPFVFAMTPNETPCSTRANTSRPDAIVRRKESWRPDNKTHWFDIAVPLEFKKSVNDRQDNERKVIWSLHNIMREDPLRRFAFGITIEGTDLRIWCIDRALLAVSTPVDVTTEIDHVIALFLLIAQQTDVGLGWDPTIERIRKKNVHYVFTICGKRYTTIEALSTCGADATVSRATRVYKAEDENGNIVAIKDSWRDSTREHEGAIVERIHEDIKNKFKEEAEEAKKYFVQIQTYEDVQISGEPDKTLDPGEGGTWIMIDAEPVLSQRLHLPSTGHVPDCYPYLPRPPFPTAKENVKIPCRVHARVVFKDVGKPLSQVHVLNDYFSCLCDALKALYYLHLSGWVHRDFSITNVLWVKDKPGSNCFTGKLTDFEFAKRVDDDTSHDVRTGTMYFMAIEVDGQKYMFLSKILLSSGFRMNPLHDLESLWWASIWGLFYYTDSKCPTLVPGDQGRFLNMAFPGRVQDANRHRFFTVSAELDLAFATLSETYRGTCGNIKIVADELRERYTTAEATLSGLPVPEEVLRETHSTIFCEVFDVKDKLQPGIQLTSLQQALKRKNADDSPGHLEGKRLKPSA